MREQFQEELNSVSATLVQMAGLVKTAMENATTALLTADLALAERVIAEDSVVDEIQHELDARTINLIARQGPVASDLRTLVTSLRMSADLERMGDLAHHIAKSALIRSEVTKVLKSVATGLCLAIKFIVLASRSCWISSIIKSSAITFSASARSAVKRAVVAFCIAVLTSPAISTRVALTPSNSS